MSDLLAHLARASVAGGVFVAGVWLLCRLAPRISPGVRAGLWWAASLKLLVALVWIAPFELALLPAPEAAADAVRAAEPAPVSGGAGTVAVAGTAPGTGAGPAIVRPAATRVVPTPAPEPRRLPWREGLTLAWLAGVALGGVRVIRDLRTVRRLRRSARPVTDPALRALFDRLRERLGIDRPVELRLTAAARSPLTVGLFRPAVLLPAAGVGTLPARELEMAICHELLHVRRRDLWASWIPQVARRLFFFHPLAALAAREHTLAREAACDAAVLRELGAPAGSYGRLLLRWSARAGSDRAAAPLPEIAVAAGASSSFVHLKRRLEMLQSSSSPSRATRLVGGALALAALVALVPVRIVAHAPEPPEPPAAPTLPAPPAPPAPAALPAAVVAPTPPSPSTPPAVADVALPPAAPMLAALAAVPAPPAPPEPPEPPEGAGSYSYSYHSSNDGERGESWALLGPGDHVWMNNGWGDHDRIERLREGDEPLLWFRRDGQEWVVRDPATLARFEEILEPQRKLGQRQGELGERQGELGSRQGELGSQQGALGARQGKLGAEQGALAARQAALAMAGTEAERRAADERRRDLSEEMRALAQRQRELAERQRELGARQRELGERQREMGERQRALAAQQREAAERARPEIRALLDEAIASGVAERP